MINLSHCAVLSRRRGGVKRLPRTQDVRIKIIYHFSRERTIRPVTRSTGVGGGAHDCSGTENIREQNIVGIVSLRINKRNR
jgi:hypothetical protein